MHAKVKAPITVLTKKTPEKKAAKRQKQKKAEDLSLFKGLAEDTNRENSEDSEAEKKNEAKKKGKFSGAFGGKGFGEKRFEQRRKRRFSKGLLKMAKRWQFEKKGSYKVVSIDTEQEEGGKRFKWV